MGFGYAWLLSLWALFPADVMNWVNIYAVEYPDVFFQVNKTLKKALTLLRDDLHDLVGFGVFIFIIVICVISK